MKRYYIFGCLVVLTIGVLFHKKNALATHPVNKKYTRDHDADKTCLNTEKARTLINHCITTEGHSRDYCEGEAIAACKKEPNAP